MKIRTLAAALAAMTLPLAAEAAEWTEVLVTSGDTRAVEMADGRTVMTYFAEGGVALMAGGKQVPGGSFECAGMIDAAADGSSVVLSCATTDSDGDKVFSEVARGKESDLPPNQGRYSYTGGTGKWDGFTAQCTYEVHRTPGGYAVEFGSCTGDALPPPLQ